LKNILDILFIGLGSKNRLLIALGLSLILGFLDYLIGPELSLAVFYTLPIMLAAWYGRTRDGLVVTIFATLVWFFVDMIHGQYESTNYLFVWNSLFRLIYFLIVLRLLAIIKNRLLLEETLADTDSLTELHNRRFFLEQLERECARVRRYPEPLTLAYFDLDNFKQVNDSKGHETGDKLLKTVANILSANIRTSDYAARLGGDEFIVLFPALNQNMALHTLEKLQAKLLSGMKKHKWPVTFSIGAITFNTVMDSSKDMVKQVDNLMYKVKKSGKSRIQHIIWSKKNN